MNREFYLNNFYSVPSNRFYPCGEASLRFFEGNIYRVVMCSLGGLNEPDEYHLQPITEPGFITGKHNEKGTFGFRVWH